MVWMSLMAAVAGAAVASLGSALTATELLLLQGRPIGEPIVKYGPFVMNTREEIIQAIKDYQDGRMGHTSAKNGGE